MAECKAVLNVAGAQWQCDLEYPHCGIAHGNVEAKAIWCSDGEARRYGRQPREEKK